MNYYWNCLPRALVVILVLHSLVLLPTQMISCLFVPRHHSALRLLLNICDDFACEYAVVFNADKSKLLICMSSEQCKVVRDTKGRPFHIGGRDIEQVDSFSHFGHIITSDFSDTEDIRYRRNRFARQVNNCLRFLTNWNVMWNWNCLILSAVVCMAANFVHLVYWIVFTCMA